ncbi:hypothetical protein LIER_39930 [Lithospermum erythrorhizon]|uniref:Disease resistance R13L4/SHOC-2-like LRR domain-containing protein n=1 Tax=Lithospermum erythrorhizon TaxID=34254 RepID=A0AAV3QMA1_LITER
MAHINLDTKAIQDDMMLTGKRYIKFLKSGAFLEENPEWPFDVVKMHDIMHDFALHLSGYEFLTLVNSDNSDISHQTSKSFSYLGSKKARHLFVRGTIKPTSFSNVGKLPTCHVKRVPQNVILDLIKQLKVVKALYLSDCNLEELPEDIGKLIHLRTLDLSANQKLRPIPETIGELYNLQFLFLEDLGYFFNPSLLPETLGKLINLQELKEFPVVIGKSKLGGERFLPNWLTSLSYLKELRLFDNEGSLSTPSLGKLPSLEKLYIEYFPVLKYIGRGFIGLEDNTTNKQVSVIFPKLLLLELSNCGMLEEWEDIKAEDEDTIIVMSKLKCLRIIRCDNLKVLPHRLIRKATSLEELTFPDGEL